MQRLHEDDLAGYLIEQGGWELVSFPAIAEQGEEYLITRLQALTLYAQRWRHTASGARIP